MLERHLDLRRGRGRGPTEELTDGTITLRKLRHPGVGKHLVGELPMLLRDRREQHLLELDGIHLAHALVLAGDHDVDAVRLVAHVLVDPLELDLELLGREADGAQDAEPAAARDGGDDVAAMGERENGELDAELVAERGVHDLGT